MSKLYTKKGWLTIYGLACGYLESAPLTDKEGRNDPQGITLGMEASTFHVKARYPSVWEVFDRDSLDEARKRFSELCRERGTKRKMPDPAYYKPEKRVKPVISLGSGENAELTTVLLHRKPK